MVETARSSARDHDEGEGYGSQPAEWRLDVTREPEVESVLRQAPLPVIATVRSLDHGGHFDGTKEEQLRLLSSGQRQEEVHMWTGSLEGKRICRMNWPA